MLIPITKLNGLNIRDATLQASNSSLPQGSLAQGAQFSFPVTWNLTQASIQDATGASFGSVSPGVKTTYLVLSTTNAVAQYSNSLPITLQENEVSSDPFLALTPQEVDFGGIVIGSPGAATGLDSSFTISNTGSMPLTISGSTYTNGTAEYNYLGCYSDGAGRKLQKVYDLGASNDNGICQTKCQGLGYTFAGTECHSQCWCGSLPPQAVKYTPESAKKCTFGCTSDTTQACGGDGAYISIYYDSAKYVPDYRAVPCSNVYYLAEHSRKIPLAKEFTRKKSHSQKVLLVKHLLARNYIRERFYEKSISSHSRKIPLAKNLTRERFYRNKRLLFSRTLYPTKKAWAAQLLATDNMSPDLCISALSSANAIMKPGTSTYAVFGLEYGRECWVARSLVQSQTSLIGNKACTIPCKGMSSISCGGAAMYDYYVPTSYQTTLTATSVPVSTTGTVQTTSTTM